MHNGFIVINLALISVPRCNIKQQTMLHLLTLLLLVTPTSSAKPSRKIINARHTTTPTYNEPPGRIVDSYPTNHRFLPGIKSGGTTSNNVDCQGSWGGWSTCVASTGRKTRTYTHTTSRSGSGTSCSYTHNFQQSMSCPVNCVGAFATNWETCDATTGTQSRPYVITTIKRSTGTACSHSSSDTESQDCLIDCEISSSTWSLCVSSSRTKTWTVNIKAFNGGATCTSLPNAPSGLTNVVGATADQTEACTVQDCAGEWSAYDTCNPSTSLQTKTYTVTQNKAGSGNDCAFADGATQDQSCIPDINCIGEWGTYSSCVAGEKQRTYSITTTQSGSGTECSNTHEEIETKECPFDTITWDYFIQKSQWTTPLFQQHPLPNSTEMKIITCPIGKYVNIQWENTEHSHDVFEMTNHDSFATCNFSSTQATRLSTNENSGNVRIDCNSPIPSTKYYACSVGDACNKGFQRIRIHTTDPSKTQTLRETSYTKNGVERTHSSLASILENHLIELAYNGHHIATEARAIEIMSQLESILENSPLSCSDWWYNPSKSQCDAFVYTDMGFVERGRPVANLVKAEENYAKAIQLQPTWCAAQGYRTQLLLKASANPNTDAALKAQYLHTCQVCVPSHGMETVQLAFAHLGVDVPSCSEEEEEKVVVETKRQAPGVVAINSNGNETTDESDLLGIEDSLSQASGTRRGVKKLLVSIWIGIVLLIV